MLHAILYCILLYIYPAQHGKLASVQWGNIYEHLLDSNILKKNLLQSFTTLEANSEKNPYNTTRMLFVLFVHLYCKCCLSLICVFLLPEWLCKQVAAQAGAWQLSHEQGGSTQLLKQKTCLLLFTEQWDMFPKSSEGAALCSWCYCQLSSLINTKDVKVWAHPLIDCDSYDNSDDWW